MITAGALILAASTLAFFENYTAYFRLTRLDKSVSLLKDLDSIADHQAVQDGQPLAESYKLLRDRLKLLVAAPEPVDFSLGSTLLKAFAASVPWLLLALIFSVQAKRGDPAATSAALGVLFVMVIFASVATLLPDTWGPTVIYIVYPVGHFITVLALMYVWQIRKRRVTTNA